MGKGLLFFCCACCILVLTIVNLSIGPIVKYGAAWGTLNCAQQKDKYDKDKEDGIEITDKKKKYEYDWKSDECDRKKGMHDMEYTAFIFDIVIGFVCGLIGLLHLFDLKKDFVVNTGLIGLVCGAVGFILTFVYVIFNGLVYTNYYYLYPGSGTMYKIDGDGAFAELDGNRYKCFYFDKDAENTHSYYAKFSDWGKKQYNYNKGLAEDLSKIDDRCKESPSVCERKEYYRDGLGAIKDSNNNDCKLLYTDNNNFRSLGITNKDISDRFLTALILSLFVCLANIGLALFGFLLFRSPDGF